MKTTNLRYIQPLRKKAIIIFLFLFFAHFFSIPIKLFAEILSNDAINYISINIDQYIDLANLEYDDSPYPGRTNLGHVFIPYIQINIIPVSLNIGGWYKHIYVQYDEDNSPAKMYPYMNAIFFPWDDSEFIIGNFPNLADLPNTIYN